MSVTAQWIGSPNYDKKRTTIDRIVIHWFGAGNQVGADRTFQKVKGTSAHYSIENSSIHHYVKEEYVAYHAGVYSMNQRSIGIEHSAEPKRPATEETYQTSGRLLAEICARHNIPLDRTHIIKHSEVPRATACPGTIDLDKLIRLAKEASIPTNVPVVLQKYGKGSLADLVLWFDQTLLWLDEARKNGQTLTGERDNARSEVSSTQEALKSAKQDCVDYELSLTKLLPDSGYTKDKSGLVQRLTIATEIEDKLVTIQKAFDSAKEDYQQKLDEASRKILALEKALAELKEQVVDLQNNVVHEQKKESFIEAIIRLLKGGR